MKKNESKLKIELVNGSTIYFRDSGSPDALHGISSRHNLWHRKDGHAKVVCYGSQSDMNTIALTAFAGIDGDVFVLPDGAEPDGSAISFPGMTITKASFQAVPTFAELESALAGVRPPLCVEITQDNGYIEIFDVETVLQLHDFLENDDAAPSSSHPFYLEAEEIRDWPDDLDHPSLTAQERNPSLR